MTNRVLLNNVDHAQLKVITRRGPQFGDNVNEAPVFPTEFAEVQREYAIFFRRDAKGAFQAVAPLGLDKGENLFLDEHGWHARYMPAILERGPFLIGLPAQESDGEAMIHVDLDDPRISTTEGEALFLPQGGNSPYLERIARVLRVIHRGAELNAPMFAAFEAAGLIEPVAMEVKLGERETYSFPDYYTLAADRLAELDGARLEALNRAGFLYAAFLVISSLNNVSRLIDIKLRRRAAG